MKHDSTAAIIAGAIEIKGDDDEPINVVTKALADLTQTVDDRLKAVETKGADKALLDRLDKIETKLARPGAAVETKGNEPAVAERKALASFVRTGSDIEIKAAASDNNPEGGWLVLPTVDTSIRTLAAQISPMRRLAEVASISTSTLERFYSLGVDGATWVSERDDRPQDTDTPELIKVEYGTSELYAAPAATRHLLEDASVDIASWFINDATRKFAKTEGVGFMRGDGVAGRPRGLLDYGTTSEEDFTRAWGKHQYVPVGAASAPTDDQLAKALITLMMTLGEDYRGNARWLMNRTTAIRVRQLQDTAKRFLWAPTGNLIEGEQGTLLGYPVEYDAQMDNIGADAHPIAFGDFRQGYVIIDRQGIRVERDAVTKKGRVLFDTYKRTGGGAGDFNAIKFLKIATA